MRTASRHFFKIRSVIFIVFFATSMPVHANSNTMMQLLKVLHAKGTIDDETYALLKQSAVADDKVTTNQASELKSVVEKSKSTVSASISDGHLKFKTADGDFKLQLGGRIMADTAWYDSDEQDIGHGTELRRARIFTKGSFWKHWHFKAQYDFAGNSAGIKDAYIAYTGLGQHLPIPLTVTVGNHFEPFGLEILTSSKYITFMERSLSSVFVPGRNMGLSIASHGKNWTTSMGLFGQGIDNENQNGNESYAFASRATFAPLYQHDLAVHLGAAFEYRQLKDSDIRVKQRPESHISNVNLVDASLIEANDSVKWGVEAATVLGPFSLQAEYMDVSYDTRDFSDVNFNGWYTHASWFLTGESRNYRASIGKFVRVKPNSIVGKNGYGAWELGVRYSAIDLNDGAVTGGREDNVTIGLNWYATPSIRFMANYIFTDSERKGISDNPQLFQLRSQIDF